jgi:hypothetical protein
MHRLADLWVKRSPAIRPRGLQVQVEGGADEAHLAPTGLSCSIHTAGDGHRQGASMHHLSC